MSNRGIKIAIILVVVVAALVHAQATRLAGASQTGGYQRFVPVPRYPENAVIGLPISATFALDTKTGQLCRTYYGGVDSQWQGLPSCAQLYREF